VSEPCLLDVRRLSVAFGAGARETRVVDRVSFKLERGRTLAGPFGMVLDAMVKANGLTWFTDGGAVHVATGAETATKTITPTAARMDVCGALRGAGLDGEGQRVVTGDRTATRVTGSPDFISTVEAILKSTPSSEASGMTLVKFGQVIHE